METWMMVIIGVIVVVAALAGLWFWGSKLQKRYDEQQQLVNQHKQVVQLFVIDKKKDKVDNLKLPKQVKEQLPKMQRRRKLPAVIVKAGPQITTLLCDEAVYNSIPTKKNIKAEVAGIMIVGVVGGKLAQPEKLGFAARMRQKANELRNK